MTPFKLVYYYINMKLIKNQICVVKIIQGGGVAAPIASQVLGEVLPYLEIKKDNEKDEDKKEEVIVPNVIGKTVEEAKKVLKENGLGIDLNTQDKINEKEIIIKEQMPKSGIKVYKDTKIFVEI